MVPKAAAATMIGTIASPSRPSVRFTALPAPTMTNAPTGMKNQPRLTSQSLKNGNVSDDENSGVHQEGVDFPDSGRQQPRARVEEDVRSGET